MTRDSTDFTGTPEVTAAQVIDFLRRHPDSLNRHPEVFENQSAPARELGAGVADFQSAMIQRLRADVAGHSDRQRELIDTSRANLTIQARVHECVLSLLEARSFEKVIETVATDLTINSMGWDVIHDFEKTVPMGRLADKKEIAYAVAWLASPESDFVTGQLISPTGGQTIVGI